MLEKPVDNKVGGKRQLIFLQKWNIISFQILF